MLALIAVLGMAQRAVATPKGFRPVTETEVLNAVDAREAAMKKAMLGNGDMPPSRPRCYVRREGKGVAIGVGDDRQLTAEEYKALEKKRDAYPGKVKLGQGAMSYHDEKNSLKVEDGWLSSSDVGEWGGGIFWFDKDWKTQKELYHGNAHPIYKTADGLYTLVGFSYAGQDGKLVKIEREKDAWKVNVVATIGYSVEHSARLDANHILFVRDGLKKIDLKGKIESLCSLPEFMKYPNTMARADDGTVYVTKDQFLLALSPTGSTYRRTWFEVAPPADPPLTVNSRPSYGLPANLRS